MANIKLNEYKPKYGQDPAMFNEMYINYINQLTSDAPEAQQPQPYMQKEPSNISSSTAETYEDKNDDETADEAKPISTGNKAPNMMGDTQ